jgi:hypothetical protein
MNENERDRRVDAAWSAASREEPPPTLDAAIHAAARRAVDAGPARKRDRTWRYPLAAAAVVALLAIGIVQLTPPEQVAPTIVAETQTAMPGAAKDVAQPPQKAKEDVPSEATINVPVPAASPPPQPRAGMALKGNLAERAPSPPIESGAAGRSQPAKRELEALDKLARVEPEAPRASAAPPVPAPARVAPPLSEPFPAAAAPERAAAAPRLAEQAPPPPATQPSAATAAPEPARDADRQERKSVATSPARVPEERAVSSARPRPPETSSSGATQGKVSANDARIEEWIKRIRDLKREGRTEEAAKELAAFRTAYGTRADALLPADLRESAK